MKPQCLRMFLFLPILAALCLGAGASTNEGEPEPLDYYVDKDRRVYPESKCSGALPFLFIGKQSRVLLFYPCESGDDLPKSIQDSKSPECPAGVTFGKAIRVQNGVKFEYKGCTATPMQVWKLDFKGSLAESTGESPGATTDGEPPELGNGPGTFPEEDEDEKKDEHQKKEEGGGEKKEEGGSGEPVNRP